MNTNINELLDLANKMIDESLAFSKMANVYSSSLPTASGFCPNKTYVKPVNQNIMPVPKIKRAVFKLDLFDKKYDEKLKKNIKIPRKNPVLVTKVEFLDNTYVIVKNCEKDNIELVEAVDPVTNKPLGIKIASNTSKEMAVAYAVFKRMYGKPNANNKLEYVSTSAGNYLNDVIANSWDQDFEESMAEINKDRAREANIKKHEAIQKAAHDRKVKREAKRLRLEAEARAYNESKTLEQASSNSKDYVRPDKKFKDFTAEERRAYWRNQKKNK